MRVRSQTGNTDTVYHDANKVKRMLMPFDYIQEVYSSYINFYLEVLRRSTRLVSIEMRDRVYNRKLLLLLLLLLLLWWLLLGWLLLFVWNSILSSHASIPHIMARAIRSFAVRSRVIHRGAIPIIGACSAATRALVVR